MNPNPSENKIFMIMMKDFIEMRLSRSSCTTWQ